MSEGMPSINFMPQVELPDRGVAARQFLRVLRRHIRLFFGCAAAVLIIGSAALFLLKPSYTATAIVTMAPQSADPLAPSGQPPADVVEDDLPATEASMMQSRDVAAAVLAQIPPAKEALSFSLRGSLCHVGISFLCKNNAATDSSARQQAEIDGFLGSLSVVPQLHSRVINVSVTAGTGPRAAMLADAVVSNYQRIALNQQTETINRVAAWLDGRTAELQQRWLDAVRTANAYSVSRGLTNAIEDNAPSPLVNTQIANMAASLGAAQAQLAAAQARAAALRDATLHGDASGLVSLSDQPILVAAANNLMQLESTRDQLAAEFGPHYPKIEALDRQIAENRATLNGQTHAALGSISESLVSARAEVQQLTDNLNQLKSQASAQSAKQAEYLTLIQQAQSARTIYETFLEHENEVVDRAALLEPPVILVSHASIPSRPTFPNKPKLVLGLLVLALAAGLVAIFIKDYFSVGFVEMEDLRASVSLPLLATLPFVTTRGQDSIASHVSDAPFSRTSEAVRGLVTKLAMLATDGTAPRAILVTSAGAIEGKSTLAVWLATTVRQGGQSVLVIDGDHRRGSLMPRTATTHKLGMTDLLAGRATPAEVIQSDPATQVDFIAAGGAMSRPFGTEEIARLRDAIGTLKKSYSLIVIDSPPLLAMTDGFVHGSIADQTVFVCRWQQTSRIAVTASLDRLRAYGTKVAGIVVTMVDENSTLAFGGEYSRRETKLITRLYGS
jgi:polysaccharide biosynthesis transport protein